MKGLSKYNFNVSEIFYSIQGEGTRAGLPCVFVRLQGCRLRCSWCDTPYALEINQTETLMNGAEIIEKIKSYDCHFVEFTGGEPFEQAEIHQVMKHLVDLGFVLAVETSGYIDLAFADKRIIKILDVKCPGSGMSKKNKYENFEYLTKIDEVKFVIADRADYDFAKGICDKYSLGSKCDSILFSPVFGKLDNLQLAEWILADRLNVRMQVQMHKYIWHPDKRGV